MDLEHWSLRGEEKIVPVKLKNAQVSSWTDLVQQYSIYVSKVNGEIVFVLNYSNGETVIMTEEQITQLAAVRAAADDDFDLEEICRKGNRRGPGRLEPYLPDAYVYNYALANSLEVRGEAAPETFEEFLRVVTRVNKPAESQSVHSPGLNQQFTSAAAIMAEPAKLTADPEDAPSPPKRAPRKRPGPKAKQPSGDETPAAPKQKKRAAPAEKKEAEPKRRKAAAAAATKDPVDLVISKIGERIKKVLDGLSPESLHRFKTQFNYEDVAVAKFTLRPASELDLVTILFGLTYLWSTQVNSDFTFKLAKQDSDERFIDLWSDLVCAVAGHCANAAKKTFDNIGLFTLQGLCWRTGSKSKTFYIYHNSLVRFLEKLIQLDEEALEQELTTHLKSLNESGNSKRLLLYCDSLLNPTEKPAPQVNEGDF